MPDVTTVQHRAAADGLKQLLAAYRDSEDLISIGAYQTGANRQVDVSLRMREAIQRFLQQGMSESTALDITIDRLLQLAQVRDSLMQTATTQNEIPSAATA
jgi:flagellar biosynthesis/type III secretory pathway ATPase